MTSSKDKHTARSTKRRSPLMLILLAAGILVAGLLLARGALGLFSPHLYSGTVFQTATPAPPMDGLLLDSGEPADLAQFAGKVVLVYFGYTNCPDVCPTTLSDVAQALDSLGSDGDNVTLLMVTIDPARDPLAETGAYVRFFDDRFYGAGGSEQAISDVATQYGVYFKAGEVDEDGGYDMDHTASLMGIDTDGNLRIVWPPGIDSELLANDLEALLK